MFEKSKISIIGYSYDWIPKTYKSFEQLHKEFMIMLLRLETRKYNVEV